jgi:hypothetical protein
MLFIGRILGQLTGGRGSIGKRQRKAVKKWIHFLSELPNSRCEKPNGKLTPMQRKRSRSPSPDSYLMSESEIMAEENFDTLDKDLGHAFANEMGLEFDGFCVEQLEKELSAGEPQLIRDDEMDDDLWVSFP